jgi:hypothetical protein
MQDKNRTTHNGSGYRNYVTKLRRICLLSDVPPDLLSVVAGLATTVSKEIR